MSRSVIDILQDCRLFSAVEGRGFQRLVTMARICRFDKGEMIFREGQPCPGAYIVDSGLVRVFKTAAGGKEHVLHMVGPGHTFAEVAAIGRFDCPANAEAIAPTTCALLPGDLLRKGLEEDHGLCLGLLGGMTVWVRHLVGVMEGVVLRDAAGRLARFLLDSECTKDDTVALPGLKRHVASHLNLTSETFSRILHRLVDDQLIVELEGHRVRLLDRQKLTMIAKGLSPKV